MSLTERCINYFDQFSQKNLVGLHACIAENITLRDWDTEVAGRQAVLELDRVVFDNVKHINVKVLNMIELGNTVVSELEIHINHSVDRLLVVDVMEFNEEGAIECIRAYRG
jgi:SnoaL-like protein